MWKTIFIEYKKEAVQLFFVLILSAGLILFGWSLLKQTELFFFITDSLYHLTAKAIEFVSGAFNDPLIYNSTLFKLTLLDANWSIDMPSRAYLFYTIPLITIILMPLNKYYTILIYAVLTVLFIVVWAMMIMIFKIYFIDTVHFNWLFFVEKSVYLPSYLWIIYLIKQNRLLELFASMINERILAINYFTFQQLGLFLILLNTIPLIILQYSGELIPLIISWILNGSKYFLELKDFHPVIDGNKIFLGENWIKIEPLCIGIGIWSLVIVLIITIRGSFVNKLIYMPLFTFFFLLTNSIRLANALQYIYENYGKDGLNLTDLHNDITYVMYIVAFVFLALYILWFHNLKFKSKSLHVL